MPNVLYQLDALFAYHLACLRPAQRFGLALWVYGTILAKSACQNAVLAALLPLATFHNLRQRLREWLYDGTDKARPTQVQLDVRLCFAPLLGWVLSLWKADTLVLVLDATGHRDRLSALVISVVYRGGAIPVAWHLLPGNVEGAWNPHWGRLLRTLAPAVPASVRVQVLADRGLWSPSVYAQIATLGWHPLMRVRNNLLFRPNGRGLLPARALVRPGTAWIGQGVAFRDRAKRLPCTLVALWLPDKDAPCLCVTTLPPAQVAAGGYGLRAWIEGGFRVLKSMGWQWEKTRRTDCERASRHWLVLAVATLLTMLAGSQQEDRAPLPKQAEHPVRLLSIFRRGWQELTRQLCAGHLRTRLWFKPEPVPTLEALLQITRYCPPDTS